MDSMFQTAQLAAYLGLLVWGVGIPVGSACLVCRHRHHVYKHSVKAVYGAVYEGFRIPRAQSEDSPRKEEDEPNFWYWELLVVLPRKVLLAAVAVTVRNAELQAALICLVLSASLVVHVASLPYEATLMNAVETAALTAICVSAFGGLALGDELLVGEKTESAAACIALGNCISVDKAIALSRDVAMVREAGLRQEAEDS
ncbi:Contig5629.g6032, partial [Symbiodinium sp. KB8]